MSSPDQPDMLRRYALRITHEMMGRTPNGRGSEITVDKCFREQFGCGSGVVVSLWTLIMENDFTVGTEEKQLLLTLLFLKVY
jgi:hypothetical protein